MSKYILKYFYILKKKFELDCNNIETLHYYLTGTTRFLPQMFVAIAFLGFHFQACFVL